MPSASAPAGSPTLLDEAASLALVKTANLPVVEHRVCRSLDAALVAFAELGPAVAMKACAAGIPHKSDYGLVLLDLTSESKVSDAFAAVKVRLEQLGVTDHVVTVASMVKGQREFMLGARLDPVFGPVVMIGDGGRYVEAMKDTAVLLAPLTAEQAGEALSTLRIAPLLGGFRGDPPLDVDALCDAAVRLGDLIAAPGARLSAVDLNPVIVRERGCGVVIVDALVERAE